MQLIIFIGVQGAGKSTFAQRFYDSHIRLNRDMLKTQHRERLLFEACLESKTPTIIDKTNPTKADRTVFIQPALARHFEVIAYYFDVPYEEALERNNQRDGKRKVPEVGLKHTLKLMERPTFDEGFKEIHYVTVVNNDFIINTSNQQTV